MKLGTGFRAVNSVGKRACFPLSSSQRYRKINRPSKRVVNPMGIATEGTETGLQDGSTGGVVGSSAKTLLNE